MYFKSVTIIVDLFDSLYCIIINKRNCLHMCSLKLKKVFIQIFFVGWWKFSNLCLLTLLIHFVILDNVENRLDYTGSSWIQRLRLFKLLKETLLVCPQTLYNLPIKNGYKNMEVIQYFLVTLYIFFTLSILCFSMSV